MDSSDKIESDCSDKTVTSSSLNSAIKEVYKKKRVLFRRSKPSGPEKLFPFLTQPPVKPVLQKYLGRGEFPPFQHVAMFESNFLQVTRTGKHLFFHNHYHEAIIGIATTNTKLPLPNLMFIARPVDRKMSSGKYHDELTLTRLLPLKFVHISIHDPEKQLIKIKLINGRSYYLQLHTSTEEKKDLFNHWLSLVHLLQHPPPSYLQPHPKSCMQADELHVEVIPSQVAMPSEGPSSKHSVKEEKQQAPSNDSVPKEIYTESEALMLQAPYFQSECSLDEVETYQGSSMAKRETVKKGGTQQP